jgi:molybdopterin converting factor small subunit
MLVTVKLFATLTRFKSGVKAGHSFDMDLPDTATAQEIIDRLKIPVEEIHIVFVNNVIQAPSVKLQAGDVVGIFPPVGGG